MIRRFLSNPWSVHHESLLNLDEAHCDCYKFKRPVHPSGIDTEGGGKLRQQCASLTDERGLDRLMPTPCSLTPILCRLVKAGIVAISNTAVIT